MKELDKYRLNESRLSSYGKDPTSSLMHFNGADASTVFIDETGRNWGMYGNPQLDTAQQVFGTASLLLTVNDYIHTEAHEDLNFGTGNFTIDMRIRFASFPTLSFIAAQRIISGVDRAWQIYTYSATPKIHFAGPSVGTAFNTSLSINTWYHIAIVRYGNTVKCYINGTAEATTLDVTGQDFHSKAALMIGNTPVNFATEGLNGWIDEFRISKVARWTSNFTPPSEPY